MTADLTLFDHRVRVFGAPSRYIQGSGAIAWLGPAIKQLGTRALVVSDALVRDLLQEKIIHGLLAHEIDVQFLEFSGDLLEHTAAEIASGIRPGPEDVVLALGGGRAIDTGKALSEALGLPVVTMPTAASTDAPTSKNFVIYDENHILKQVRHLPRNPDFVIVDTEILLKAPRALFAAGIGDALAKYFEARACAAVNGRNMFQSAPTITALAVATQCLETLLSKGASALDDLGGGSPTKAFEDVVEATILMAGLGFENGGLSVAHALTRGLSRLEGATHAPHGFQVTYGLLVQLALEDVPVDRRMASLIRYAGLPTSLQDMLGRPATEADLAIIANGSIDVPHMRNFPHEITADALIHAMASVEQQSISDTATNP